MTRSLTVSVLAVLGIAASAVQAGVPGAYRPGYKPSFEPKPAPPATYRPQGERAKPPATYRPSYQPGATRPSFSPAPRAPKKSYTPPGQ